MSELQQLISDIESLTDKQSQEIAELKAIILSQSETIKHLNKVINEKRGAI